MNTRLSVNLNKVALVRNTRMLGIPSVTRSATLCLQAGAHGITVHPRPDQRHIRAQDVHDLAEVLRDWPDREYNIEGNPFHNLMDLVRQVRPHQVTFVPDSETQFTSDHGWRFPEDAARLRDVVREAQDLGARVSLFMDADARAMGAASEVGADRVELYTEPYAASHGSPQGEAMLAQFVAAAKAANVSSTRGNSVCLDCASTSCLLASRMSRRTDGSPAAMRVKSRKPGPARLR